MKRTEGQLETALQGRRQAREALAQRPLAQVNTVASLRELLKAVMDYLQIPYREA